MDLGVVFSQADSGTDANAIRAWVQTAEAEGFDHVMAYDHILGASLERLGPGPFGNFPGPPYTAENTFHEILVLFSHLAAVTERIEFVTSVLVLPQRQAALAAKQISTIDLLSGGRLRVAVGVGWNFAEYEGVGADFSDRVDVLAEQIEVMRALWTEPIIRYEGRFHHLEGVGINPRPTRRIPIYMGTGGSDAALRRVVRTADGWMPLLLPGLDPIDFRTGVERLRQLAVDADRDPATLPIHGRVYLGDGWQKQVEETLEVGVAHLSIGFNRMANRGLTHAQHLDAVLAVKPELDQLVGRS
jgi:probable F420-dependent oxidoreductase